MANIAMMLIDSNELATAPKIVEQISKRFTVTTAKLQVGDINVLLDDGRLIIIERKQTSDLLASISDGRIFDQVNRMVELSPWSFIVINGLISFNANDMTLADNELTNWRGSSVRNALLAVQLAGCVVTSTVGVGLCNIISEIISLCSKPDHNPGVHKQHALSFPPIDTRIEILSQFPGVGYKRAEAILRWVGDSDNRCDEFGSIAQAIEWATLMPLIDEQSHPEGWGKVTIANFRTALGLGPEEFMSVVKEKTDANNQEVVNKSVASKAK